jgi:predicted CoA-binding protein
MKTTLVLGASTNAERYAFKAINMLREYGHPVIAMGLKEGRVGDVDIITVMPEGKTVDTVTLYVGPPRQPGYYDAIMGLKPSRIIFNPGTENPELRRMAENAGIEAVEGCTLVMLTTGMY